MSLPREAYVPHPFGTGDAQASQVGPAERYYLIAAGDLPEGYPSTLYHPKDMLNAA